MAEADGSDFDSFVTTAATRLFKLAYLLTGNASDADDLVQETLTRVFVAWPALAALPRKQRLVVVLRYFGDLSETDVAPLSHCSVGTVKSQTSKAMSKLRDHPALKAPADPHPEGVTND